MSRLRHLHLMTTRALWLALLVGCGGDDADTRCVAGETMACELADGRMGVRACGPDFRWPSNCGDVPDGGTPNGPDIPWLADGVPPIAAPVLTPCPDGWREVAATEEGDPPTCDPYPVGGAQDCPDGQAHFSGEPGCAPVGSPCPAGDFSDKLPSDRRVVYVRPGATMGDGSEALPYGALTEFSRGGLPMGTVIALSTGMHVGELALSRGHELVGACAATTTLSAPTPSRTRGVVTFLGVGGSTRDIALSNSPRPGVWLEGEGVVGHIEGVVVDGVQHLALAVGPDARMSVRSVVVRGTRARTEDGGGGRGLTVEVDAVVEASRALFVTNREVGVHASQGSSVQLTDAVVRDTRVQTSDGRLGRGFSVEQGASARVERVLLSRNGELGVLALGDDTMLHLCDAVIRDTQGEADGGSGRGLGAEHGASADVNRVLIAANRAIGLFAGEPGTLLRSTNVIVRDTDGQGSDLRGGRGLNVQLGARAEVSRAHLSRNHDIAAFASEVGTEIVLSDVVARDTRGQQSDGRFGRGVSVQMGTVAEVERALVSGSHDFGVFASDPDTTLRLSDVVVHGTEGRMSDGALGRGLNIQFEAVADVTRTVVSENREVGVAVMAAGTASLEDVVVSRTQPTACVETTCPGFATGHGIGAYLARTVVRVRRFSVRSSDVCGVHVATGRFDTTARPELHLEDGEVLANGIGACVQVEDYDLDRLTASVRYASNGVSIETTNLPVPDTAAPVAGP